MGVYKVIDLHNRYGIMTLDITDISTNTITYKLDGTEFTTRFNSFNGEFSLIYEETTKGTDTYRKSLGDFVYNSRSDSWDDQRSRSIMYKIIRQ